MTPLPEGLLAALEPPYKLRWMIVCELSRFECMFRLPLFELLFSPR